MMIFGKYLSQISVSCLLLSCFYFFPAYGLPFSEKFTEEERSALEKGEIILKPERQRDSGWPIVKAYGKYSIPAEDAMGYFQTFKWQKNYIPNMVKSDVINEAGPVDVEYEIDMPWPLDNTKYIHRHYFKKSHQYLECRWTLVKSNAVKLTEGFIRFFPSPTNPKESYFFYQNNVHPKAIMAGLFKSQMLSDVKKSLDITRSRASELFENKVEVFRPLRDTFLKRAMNSKR